MTSAAAEKFGYSRQRYFQLLKAFEEKGAVALKSGKRGPKSNYRRTEEVVRQVIRHRFLDPDASAEIIAQKLNQRGWPIGIHSVERILEEFGLQKKLHSFRPDASQVETQRTRQRPCRFGKHPGLELHQIVQRCDERPEDYRLSAFACTALRDEVQVLTREYPRRWHIEEFFNANQALGWKRAGTLNLHIRYGQATMALLAQAAIHQLRQRIGQPVADWDASHLAQALFNGLDGDIRISDDTILVTYYNAPNADLLRNHYENLPEKLARENICPRIPWLYDFKLDFRFK